MIPGAFEQALGEAFHRLPAAVKESHRAGRTVRLAGSAKVDGARGLARIVAFLFGLPGSQDSAPVAVTKTRTAPGHETWERRIGGSKFHSRIVHIGPDRVDETFGPFTFRLRLSADDSGFIMAIESWRIGPISLPRLLAPKSVARESVSEAGLFAFDVPISAPLLGRLVHYRGELRPQSEERAP